MTFKTHFFNTSYKESFVLSFKISPNSVSTYMAYYT